MIAVLRFILLLIIGAVLIGTMFMAVTYLEWHIERLIDWTQHR